MYRSSNLLITHFYKKGIFHLFKTYFQRYLSRFFEARYCYLKAIIINDLIDKAEPLDCHNFIKCLELQVSSF